MRDRDEEGAESILPGGSSKRRDSICSPLFVDRGLASGYQTPVCKSKTVITAGCHRPHEVVTRPKLDHFF